MLHRRWFVSLLGVAALLFFASLQTPALRAAFPTSASTGTFASSIPATELLNPDGTLNLHSGRSGTVDLAGWNVSLDPQRGPVFTRDDSTRDRGNIVDAGLAHSPFTAGTWSALGNGVSSFVLALAVNGSTVYVGGQFRQVCGNSTCDSGNLQANHIAAWNGSSWSALANGVDGNVSALLVSGSTLYVGGSFGGACADAGCGSDSVNANNLATWNGSSWSAVGNGVNGPVFALAANASGLYVGGAFTTACGNAACTSNNISVNHVVRWSASNWTALGNGVDGTVRALALSGSTLYVGGSFSGTCADAGCGSDNLNANNIATWNGNSWPALGNGVNGPVLALAASGSNVFVGGSFTQACGNAGCTSGNVAVNYIAQWNGSNWSALGNGVNSSVNALALSGGLVYVGGSFDGACTDPACNGSNSINHIATWNGTSWTAVGNGVNGAVNALAPSGTSVYIGGQFVQACGNATCDNGNTTANYVAGFVAATSTPTPTPTVTNTPLPNADLSITKTAQVLSNGTQLIYWLQVQNVGTLQAQNIVVTDTLPSQVKYISIAPQTTAGVKCTYTATTRTVKCTLASLGAGKSVKIGILVQVLNTSQPFTNCAAVKASTSDLNPSNNQSCLTLNSKLEPVAMQDTFGGQANGPGNWLDALWQALTGWLAPSKQARVQ